jgi:CheY-like chemotaxis protein
MSVLLVEDNLMNQQMAKYSLVKAGADLEVANHGLEAVELIKKRLGEGTRNYDCVLMDMMMPVMDGAEATREIRRLEKISLRNDQKPHVIRRFERERRTGVHKQGETGGHERLDVEAVLPGDTARHAREHHERDVPGLLARLGGRKRRRAPQAGELAS